MRIIKTISVAVLAAMTLANCGSTKTATSNAAQGLTIITATDNVVAKKGEMSEAAIQSWPHTNVFTDSVPGMSLNKAYDFVKNKAGKTVIVGVIDSGIDVEHEDLKDVVWVNEDEIAGNGKDDDHNGYVDDIHGWNFLGGEKGQTIPEQLEMTRMVKKWMPRFDGISIDSISEGDKDDFELFVKLKNIIDKKHTSAATQLTNAENQSNQYAIVKQMIVKTKDTITQLLGEKAFNLENINSLTITEPGLLQGKMMIMRILDSGATVEDAFEQINAIIENSNDVIDHYSNQLNSQYNINFNGRVSGDDPDDITDNRV